MRSSWLAAALLALALSACAPALVWESSPQKALEKNSAFIASLTPEKQTSTRYLFFVLKVENLTGEAMAIDWNNTRYLFDGTARGLFAFAGIDPVQFRDRTIPLESIAPGQTLVKEIAPAELLARAPSRDMEINPLSAGPLPEGVNGIRLVVTAGGREIRQDLTVEIRAEPKP